MITFLYVVAGLALGALGAAAAVYVIPGESWPLAFVLGWVGGLLGMAGGMWAAGEL